MTKTALIILADGFEDIEAITPIDLMIRAGIRVTVAGLKSKSVTAAKSGLTVTVPTLFSCRQDKFDALVLPGGIPGSENLAQSSDLLVLIRTMHHQNKIIAAICAAPALVLAPSGILEGKKATCFPGMENSFPKSTTFIASPVVRDGNIITSRGAGTAFDFSLAIIDALLGKESCGKVARATVFQGNTGEQA